MDLPLISAFFLAFALTLYVFLDGFDLGVGILLLFQSDPASRDHMVDSITPTWDGNETWVIMAGITLFAAFPIAYSILLPALYLPIVLDVLHPLPVISGVTLAVGYTVLGGGWLRLKSNLLLQEFARRSIRVSAPVFAVLFGVACLYAAQIQPGVRSQWALHPIALSCLLGLFAIAAGALAVLAERVRPAILLILGLFLFVVVISGLAWIVFPNIVPFSVSLWDAASSSTSQDFVLIGAIIVTPVVLGYSAFAYWIFRGRTPEKGWEG